MIFVVAETFEVKFVDVVLHQEGKYAKTSVVDGVDEIDALQIKEELEQFQTAIENCAVKKSISDGAVVQPFWGGGRVNVLISEVLDEH